MIFTIIIFFIAILSAFGLIGRRVWEMRTGKITIEPTYEMSDWTELSIESVRDQLLNWLKIGLHHLALNILKLWIKTSYTIRRWDAYVKAKLMLVLRKNAHLPAGSTPSKFLKRISAHKNNLMTQIAKEEEIE